MEIILLQKVYVLTYFPLVNWHHSHLIHLEGNFLKDVVYLFIYLEVGGGREKEKERKIDVSEKHR